MNIEGPKAARVRMIVATLGVLMGVRFCQASDAVTDLASPNGRVSVAVSDVKGLQYAVAFDGKPVVEPSALGLTFKGDLSFGKAAKIVDVARRQVNEPWENRFGFEKRVGNRFNEVTVRLQEAGRSFGLIVRAYDDGIAFRYALPAESGLGAFVLTEERTEVDFAEDARCWAGEPAPSAEVQYRQRTLSTIPTRVGRNGEGGPYQSVPPLLVRTQNAWVSVVESDVLDWPAMFVVPTGTKRVRLSPPARTDGNGLVASTAPRQSPWRGMIVAQSEADLLRSNLVLNLATPSRIADDAWIKPGVAAWDPWWTGTNPNLPQSRAYTGLEARGDTEADKAYIDLAAEMGWQYQLVDWLWYRNMTGAYKGLHSPPNKDRADFTRSVPGIDLPTLVAYAAGRNVKLLVWAHCLDLKTFGEEKALAYLASLGVAGVKIDFFSSQTQETVQWAEHVLELAAKYKLVVDYHGIYHATGLSRTYPNLLTQEGVLGNEYNKLPGGRNDPAHQLMLPFTRGLLGPMDYTPGGFLNRKVSDFRVAVPALVMGTRARQLALAVLYLSPLTVMCDAPQHYRNQPGIAFYKNLPTVWDTSVLVAADLGRRICVARKSGDAWYVAAINLEQEQAEIPLSFLPPGRYSLEGFEDDPQADEPTAVLERQDLVTARSVLRPKLATNGGYVAVLRPRD
jgi:alpha-glucosidase